MTKLCAAGKNTRAVAVPGGTDAGEAVLTLRIKTLAAIESGSVRVGGQAFEVVAIFNLFVDIVVDEADFLHVYAPFP